MNIHTTGPSPAIPIQQGLQSSLAFSHAKKCDYNYLHPQMTLWLFSHSRIRFKNGLPCFLQPSVAPFQFLSQTLFFSASFSASSSQLGTASSVMFYKPATVDESFYVPSELAGSVSLPLGLSQISVANNFFFTCYFLSPFYPFLNLVTELTLQTQGKIHFATIKRLFYFVLPHTCQEQYLAPDNQHVFVELMKYFDVYSMIGCSAPFTLLLVLMYQK